MKVWAHGEEAEDPTALEVDSTETVQDLVRLLRGSEGDLVWLEDGEEPLDPSETVEAAGVVPQGHIHHGRCRRVDVTVRFGGLERQRRFPPSATIRRLLRWATGEGGFDLPPKEAVKHVLAVPGADHALAMGVHVGSLVRPKSCDVTLDLLPRERFEG